ncbi:hypothetical protein FE257_000232 [Aspergillus nanangensis]|uniref:Beta-lactamase-related domain-containing protein n=1 Tax=Aspergillus nanangensis TaxID=2582783 RepID=A0AAD4CZH4_ASPNN|nr:hypothetical protein FE257_000232 [Aspergillus nanangensis]
MAQVHGTCDPAFSGVRDIFAQHISSGNEIGASLCVTIDGKTVLNLWGGHADAARTKPWQENTIVPVWSTTKTLMALTLLHLADRGQLDLYAPVTKYWPEFGGDGRDDIQVRHFLSHSAGLPSWSPPLKLETLWNTPLATEQLIAQKPWWTPGTASGYHLMSQGHLIGGLVERVTGKTLGEYVREELTGPLDADFYLPVPEEQWGRIAEMTAPEPMQFPPGLDMDGVMMRAMRGSPANAEVSNTPEFRNVGVGSFAGFANAASINRVLQTVTMRGVNRGKRVLSEEMIEKIFEVQTDNTDLVIGLPVRFGMGFAIGDARTIEYLPAGSKMCFWGGWGGSIGIMDLGRKMTFTYAMNRMGTGTMGNERTHDYGRAIYAVLEAGAAKL